MWFLAFTLLPLVGATYVLWHVWQLLPFGWPVRALVVVAALSALGMMGVGFSHLRDGLSIDQAAFVYRVGNSSLFVLIYLVLAFLVLDVLRLVHVVPAGWLHANLRVTLVLAGVLTAVFVGGYVHYGHKVRRTLALDAHGKVERPVRVVMLSDLHIGYHIDRSEVAQWVDLINAEHPDLILVGGDIVDISVRPIREGHVAEELRRLEAPVYACPGNHEYYSGIREAEQFCREAGITMLRDSAVVAGGLCIVGRDDRTNGRRRALADIMSGLPAEAAGRYTIVLDHQPYHLEEAQQCGVDFQFSGHTHYGQMWPVSWITDALYECAYGPLTKGSTRYYVTSGMGIWGAKFRIGTCSEYVVATVGDGQNVAR